MRVLPDQTEQLAPSKACDVASYYAMQLALMEVGLGSFLHAFHIPFSGFLLALNQCYILNRALLLPHAHSPSSRFLPITISNTTAILKTLSPYGKKLTPMLAISMQGLLFNIGTVCFGKNILGRCVGSFLLSLWPMIQPLLLYGIIYSSLLFDMQTSLTHIPFQIILAGYIFMHISLSLAICLLTHLLPTNLLDRYDRYVTSYSSLHLNVKPLATSTKNSRLKGVWKDFTSPFFLLSLLLSALFLYTTLHSLESFCLVFFRLMAVAFVTFFLMRHLPTERCIRVFSNCSFLKKYTPYVTQVLQRMQNGSHFKE